MTLHPLQSMLSPQAWARAKAEQRRREYARQQVEQQRAHLRGLTLESFARQYVPGADLPPWFLDVFRLLETVRRVAVRGPHGIGKTVLAAIVVLWGLATLQDFKIVTTAGSWTQLSRFLWPEILKWGGRITQWPGPAPEFLTLEAHAPTGQAFAVASKNPALVEGAHAPFVIFILDEAKAIDTAMWDAIEGALSTGTCWVLAISTAGPPKGRFFDIHKRKAGLEDWATYHVTKEQAIASGRMSAEWAAARARQWGEGSAVYRNRVLGEFADDATNTVIPLSWIEAANLRWLDWEAAGLPGRMTDLGVDVGGGSLGGDPTTYAPIYDRIKVREIREYPVGDPDTALMETVGRVGGILKGAPAALAFIDVIGIGAGTVHRARELGLRVHGFSAAHKTGLRDESGDLGFFNWRAAAWWMLREIMNPAAGLNVCLPPDDRLTGELGLPTYRIVSNGLILVEDKKEIAKRNEGRSTDYADPVVMGIAGRVLVGELLGDRVAVGYDQVQIGNY